jgi:hypothetical protein
MTDLLTRPTPGPTGPSSEPSSVAGESPASRLLLAAATAGAGLIHLVMVPSHMDSSAVEGIGFAAAGWTQVVLAAVVLARPSRLAFGAVAGVNALFIAGWAWSRLFGLPFGAHRWHAESIGFVDLVAVGLETVGIVVALALVAGLSSAVRPSRASTATMGVVTLAMLGLTSAALASPDVIDHAHTSHGDHGNVVTAAGHDHEATTVGGADPAASGHGGAHHDHLEFNVQYDDLSSAAQRQVDITREFIRDYPTAADAAANGWYKGSVNLPGIAAHYWPISVPGASTPEQVQLADELGFDLYRPMLLYDGEGSDAPIVGVSYMVPGIPPGFDGEFDVWHEHLGVCLKDLVAIADIGDDPASKISMTPDQCTAAGGTVMPMAGQYMVHVWSVPGWESGNGIFSHDHPDLY